MSPGKLRSQKPPDRSDKAEFFFFKAEFRRGKKGRSRAGGECPDPRLGLSEDPSPGKGRGGSEREDFPAVVFWEQSQGGSWRGAQVHRSGRMRDPGLFPGLGIVFKDLSRCIKGERSRKMDLDIYCFV